METVSVHVSSRIQTLTTYVLSPLSAVVCLILPVELRHAFLGSTQALLSAKGDEVRLHSLLDARARVLRNWCQ